MSVSWGTLFSFFSLLLPCNSSFYRGSGSGDSTNIAFATALGLFILLPFTILPSSSCSPHSCYVKSADNELFTCSADINQFYRFFPLALSTASTEHHFVSSALIFSSNHSDSLPPELLHVFPPFISVPLTWIVK